MAIKLTGSIEGGKQTADRLAGVKDALHGDLRKTVTALGYDLENLVKRKLSGPVLKVRSGNLRGSINTRISDSDAAITASVGTSVGAIPYARVHEFGGTILPKTAPYLAFKTPDGAWHRVKQVHMPERSYLRSSLADKRALILDQIAGSIKRARDAQGFKA